MALVVGVVAGKVTVGLQTQRRVAAAKEELFPVAHLAGCPVVSSRPISGIAFSISTLSLRLRRLVPGCGYVLAVTGVWRPYGLLALGCGTGFGIGSVWTPVIPKGSFLGRTGCLKVIGLI